MPRPAPTPLLAALFLTACAPDVLLVVQPDDTSLTIEPAELVLERAADCTDTALTVVGEGTLEGIAWYPEEGSPDAVIVPDLEAATLGEPLSFAVQYCPPDDTPSVGWLLFTFDQERSRAVFAQEAP